MLALRALRSPRSSKCSLRDPRRGSTRLPRGAKWLSEGPKIDQEASKRLQEGCLSFFRAPDPRKSCSRRDAVHISNENRAPVRAPCTFPTTLERAFFEPLRSPRARKQSRKVVSQASSSNGRSNGRRGFEALRHHLEKDARRSGRSSGRRRFEALSKPLASKRLSWKRLR